jgi:predicted DNA-binding protein (UPF0251 family)
MTRPKIPRKTCGKPRCSCFKPEGPLNKDLLGVILQRDEFEAIKLHDVDNLSQKEASKKMNISQPTFARILSGARKKLSKALVKGEEIRIK